MIKVTYEPQAIRMTIEGHSGSAPKGQDLICAAASMLGLTLVEYLQEVGGHHAETVKDGFIQATGDENTRQAFEFVMCGFRMMNSLDPEHVVAAEKFV